MRYYAKINIDKNPKRVSSEVEKCLGYDASLTFEDLRNLGVSEGDVFYIYEDDDGRYYIDITKYRLETPEEVAARVAKEEAYNKKYDEYHANKNKDKNK